MTPQQQAEIDPVSGFHELSTLVTDERRNQPTHKLPFELEDFSPGVTDKPRTVRVALAGCGVVGGGLVRLLHESSDAIAGRFGVRFELTRVLVRDVNRERSLPLDSRLYTNDLDEFLAHDAEVVIEAVGGTEPARTIAYSALKRGKKVITANKELVASYGDTLSDLANENETGLDFGAAVGGSAPVISTLRDLIGTTTPRSVRGILNGTSNFVITQLERGVSLEAALASARQRGLAEADCTRDLDGSDAAAKLAIVAWIAFGIRPASLRVRRTPLIPGLENLVRFASLESARLRLLAECTQLPGHRVATTVEPVIVAPESVFGRTILEENRVEVDLGWSSPLSVSGPGAGGRPTAAALLSDLLRVSPPPNDRGAGLAQFASVPDPREHRWLVATTLDITALRHTAKAGHLPAERFIIDGKRTAIITAPVSFVSLERLTKSLESLNAAPCVARYEAAAETEVVQ
jgi:homoserine dehydrogenase